jgi:peroxiredoxin (alkyl hydroperoxide reductase subunit C)
MECCLKKRILTIGNNWPNFSIKGLNNNDEIIVVNNDFIKGKKVIFFFYPLDFTFVCPREIHELAKINDQLELYNAILITVSTDSVYSHKEWKKQLNNINFIMGSDGSHNLSQKLGVLNEEGVCSWATYIINEEGVIKWLEVAPENIGRDIHYVVKMIQAIHSNGLCPSGWKPGDCFITK